MQALIVSLLVIGCSTYAAWTLMPVAARRALASTLLKWPLPSFAATRLRRAATTSSGCGCDGCDHAPAKVQAQAKTQVVTFHPRPPR
jgi:hypothetical protein